MDHRAYAALVLLAIFVGGGCRAATRITDAPRVDLDLTGGNRGYLIGSPPAAGPQKTTRQMVETTIEIPTFYKPKPSGAPAGLEGLAPPEMEMDVEAAPTPTAAVPAGAYDTYVVQKGDSLWSIAAKPEIYGKATAWRRIFDANQDLLKGDPDALRPGMRLRIPRGEGGADLEIEEEEGVTTFKK